MLCGALPLTVYWVAYVALSATALSGPARFERVAAALGEPRWAGVGLGVLVALVALHGGARLRTLLPLGSGEPSRPPGAAWRHGLQRLSGLVLVPYLALHLYTFWWLRYSSAVAPHELYALLAARWSTTDELGLPVDAGFELLGVAAASYHAGVGLSRAGVSLGGAMTEQAERRAGRLGAGLGWLCFLFGSWTVLHLATGGLGLP